MNNEANKQKAVTPLSMFKGDSFAVKTKRLNVLSRLAAMPEIPWPNMTTPMYRLGRLPAKENTEAYATPMTNPKNRRRTKTDQKPAASPRCAKIGKVTRTIALSM